MSGSTFFRDHDHGEDDLARRLDAREAARHLRTYDRCVRCKKRIPDGKRPDAKYCSDWCKRRHRFERLDEMRKEVRRAARLCVTAERCPCGEALDTRVRPGPVPRKCRRCMGREKMRELRARRRAGRVREDNP